MGVSSTFLLSLTVYNLLKSAAVLLLFLFSIVFFHGNCSSELANCMPPPLRRPRCTRLSTYSHPSSVQLSNVRVNQHLHSFIPFTGKLWNSLPKSIFPPAYDLLLQKRSVKAPLLLNWPLFGYLLLIYRGRQLQRAFFSLLFLSLAAYPQMKKKNKNK